MISQVKTKGIVLRRRLVREADHEISVYTEELGRLRLRLTSTTKPFSRLRALAEVFSESQFHLVLRREAPVGKVIGGLPLRFFLGNSFELEHLHIMSRICELMDLLTPLEQPNQAKYELLSQALETARRQPLPVTALAFGIRLLHLAGFSMENKNDKNLWDILEQVPWEELPQLPISFKDLLAIDREFSLHIQEIVHRPLKTKIFHQTVEATAIF